MGRFHGTLLFWLHFFTIQTLLFELCVMCPTSDVTGTLKLTGSTSLVLVLIELLVIVEFQKHFANLLSFGFQAAHQSTLLTNLTLALLWQHVKKSNENKRDREKHGL